MGPNAERVPFNCQKEQVRKGSGPEGRAVGGPGKAPVLLGSVQGVH